MLLGAGLARAWPHDRAHYFFDRARWEASELGLAAARLVAEAFPGRTVHVVADAAYHGPALKHLPACLTWTTRLPAATTSPGTQPRPSPPSRTCSPSCAAP